MNHSTITGMGLVPLNLPMRQPFVTALGQKRMSRNLLVAVRLENGIVGYGEASESLAWPLDTQQAMTRTLRELAPRLVGTEINQFRPAVARVWEAAGRHPTAAAALECALLDAYTRARAIPLWRWLGNRQRSVTTSMTISAWEPAHSAQVARAAFIQGFMRLKIKVTAKDPDKDFWRVALVHKAAPKAVLLLDGNQGFTAPQAVQFAARLRRHRIRAHLFEQPVPRKDWDGLAQVQREAGIPVAADESARSADETCRLVRKRIVPVVNIKLAKCGLLGALRIIRLAKTTGTRLMIGCMAESAIGLSPSVHLACGSGAFDFVDLDSHLLAVSPPCDPGFTTREARLSIHPSRPGSGVFFRNLS